MIIKLEDKYIQTSNIIYAEITHNTSPWVWYEGDGPEARGEFNHWEIRMKMVDGEWLNIGRYPSEQEARLAFAYEVGGGS